MNIEDYRTKYYPMTEIQMAYFVGREESKDGTRCLFEFYTKDSVDVMEQAINRIIAEQAALQLVFTKDGRQKLIDQIPYYRIEVIDYRYMQVEDAEKAIEKEFKRATKQNFDCFSWPLFSLKAFLKPETENIVYHFGIDLMISDGMSIRYIIQKLQEYCSNPGEAGALDVGFLNYCETQANRKKDEEWKKARAYWMKNIDEFPEAPDFMPRSDGGGRRSYQRMELELNPQEWEQISDQVMKKNISPSAFLMGAYAYTIGLYSGKKKFAINLPIFGKVGQDEKDTVGDFSSLLLIPVDMEESDFFKFCINLQFQTISALMNRSFSGIELTRELAKKRGEKELLYPVVFTSMVNPQHSLSITDDYDGFKGYTQTSQVILDCQVASTDMNQMNAFWDYDIYAFPEGLVESMFSVFCEIIQSAGKSIPEIKNNVLKVWDAYEAEHNLKGLSRGILGAELRRNSAKYPEKIAVTDGSSAWTYRKLEEKTEIMAQVLKKRGIKKGDGVLIPAVKIPEIYALILAVFRCGGYYVPLMPDTPTKRRELMRNLSEIKWEITIEDCLEISRYITDVHDEPIQDVINPEDTAYIIFTSGSTGVPKGVKISHEEAWNTINDINTRFNVDETDVILGISELNFDLSVYDLFGNIMAGSTLVFTKDHHQMKEIRSLMETYHVTIWNSVPALFTLLLDTSQRYEPYYGNNFGNEQGKMNHMVLDSSHLRLILLSGDYIPTSLPERIKRNYPNSQVISLGGATEGSIWSIFYPIEDVNRKWRTIPYGYPLSNQQIYVVDWKNDPVPPMTVGEICIGGKGVADGYAGDPEQTGLSFIEHPVLGRIYKTGDYGMLTKNGYIEFLGRRDQQVKINGYRVELGEIQKRAEDCKDVNKAVVLRTGKEKNTLALFYTGNIEEDEVRNELELNLLSYTVPSKIIKIDQFPLTSNGKIDRKELIKQIEVSSEKKLPNTEKEKEIYKIISEILEIDSFGIEDDFFSLGADSLKGIQLYNRLDEEYEVTMEEIFKNPTVASLAKTIVKKSVEA